MSLHDTLCDSLYVRLCIGYWYKVTQTKQLQKQYATITMPGLRRISLPIESNGVTTHRIS